MKINICIPVYNESENLPNFLLELKEYLKKFKNRDVDFEVVFYNDGSTDESLSLLSTEKFTILGELNNKGLGYAINQLFTYSREAQSDGVIKLDCDGQMQVNEINLFLEKIVEGKFDLIQGNRFNVSKDFKFGIIKKMGMSFFSLLFRFLGIKVNDSTNGFIYVSKKWLQDYKLISNYNSAQQIILDTKLRNLSMTEIDVSITNRTRGKSFIGIKYPINVIVSMFALGIYRKTTGILIKPGLLFFVSGSLLFLNDLVLWVRGIEDKIISNNIVLLFFLVGIQLVSVGLVIEFLKKQKRI